MTKINLAVTIGLAIMIFICHATLNASTASHEQLFSALGVVLLLTIIRLLQGK